MHGQSTEVWAKAFQEHLDRLPNRVREQVLAKVRDLGRRLESFGPERLQGRAEFRPPVGDDRVIYTFDLARNVLTLLVIGDRRAVYR